MADAQKASASKTSPRAALLRCADLAEELGARAARLARAQEAAIVPATAAYATSKQQWKFNDKVSHHLYKQYRAACCSHRTLFFVLLSLGLYHNY